MLSAPAVPAGCPLRCSNLQHHYGQQNIRRRWHFDEHRRVLRRYAVAVLIAGMPERPAATTSACSAQSLSLPKLARRQPLPYPAQPANTRRVCCARTDASIPTLPLDSFLESHSALSALITGDGVSHTRYAVILKASTLMSFHHALVKRKYHLAV